MSPGLDSAAAVRPNEALDLDNLLPWLTKGVDGLSAEIKASFQVSQFPSGWSNLTYLLSFEQDGEIRELVLRRPPFGANVRGGHDMGREFRILSALVEAYGKVPRPLAYCEDESVLGAPFYVMERLSGVILRGGEAVLHASQMATACQALVDTFTELHALDPQAVGLGDLGQPQGYVERQISGWSQRYQRARTDDIAEVDQLISWLHDNLRGEAGASLIHNDFKYDNLILSPDDPGQVLGVLDWEMATVGCPLMDLGSSLGYWTEAGDSDALKMFSPTHLPGNLNREELVAAYAKASGREVEDPVFYFAYGQLKLAVVLQQIYARYKSGATSDPRFAQLIHLVRYCAAMALAAIAAKRISKLSLGA